MNANDPHDPLPPITEKQLARLWQRRAARSRALRTEHGNRIRVLYPGRPGVTAGPDFRNALLLVEEQGLVRGDVEVHLRQHDWRAHGHHEDPNYNGRGPARRVGDDRRGFRARPAAANPRWLGCAVCSMIRRTTIRRSRCGITSGGCWKGRAYRRPDTPERMAALLNRAGDERFLGRSRVLQRPDVRTIAGANPVGIHLRGVGLSTQPACVPATGNQCPNRRAGRHHAPAARKRPAHRADRRVAGVGRVRRPRAHGAPGRNPREVRNATGRAAVETVPGCAHQTIPAAGWREQPSYWPVSPMKACLMAWRALPLPATRQR